MRRQIVRLVVLGVVVAACGSSSDEVASAPTTQVAAEAISGTSSTTTRADQPTRTTGGRATPSTTESLGSRFPSSASAFDERILDTCAGVDPAALVDAAPEFGRLTLSLSGGGVEGLFSCQFEEQVGGLSIQLQLYDSAERVAEFAERMATTDELAEFFRDVPIDGADYGFARVGFRAEDTDVSAALGNLLITAQLKPSDQNSQSPMILSYGEYIDVGRRVVQVVVDVIGGSGTEAKPEAELAATVELDLSVCEAFDRALRLASPAFGAGSTDILDPSAVWYQLAGGAVGIEAQSRWITMGVGGIDTTTRDFLDDNGVKFPKTGLISWVVGEGLDCRAIG